jgi:hypothetical protein
LFLSSQHRFSWNGIHSMRLRGRFQTTLVLEPRDVFAKVQQE